MPLAEWLTAPHSSPARAAITSSDYVGASLTTSLRASATRIACGKARATSLTSGGADAQSPAHERALKAARVSLVAGAAAGRAMSGGGRWPLRGWPSTGRGGAWVTVTQGSGRGLNVSQTKSQYTWRYS